MIKFTAVLMLVATLFFTSGSVYAIDPFEQVCVDEGVNSAACSNRLGGVPGAEDPLLGPNGTLTKVIALLIKVVAVTSVIMIIVGGLKYVISTGDSNNINSAKNTILYAVIGLVVAIFGQFIVSFVLSRV